MGKPIFIVRFPGYWTYNQVNESRRAIHSMKELNEDYHILTLQDNEIETTKFECYNSPYDKETLEEITQLTKLSIQRCLRNEEENRLRELEDE
jgi:arsenate reductase-like glutaredoxin family protein